MPRYTTLTLAMRLAGQRRRERRAPRESGRTLFCACGKLSSSGWTDGDTHRRCCACEVDQAMKDFVYVPRGKPAEERPSWMTHDAPGGLSVAHRKLRRDDTSATTGTEVP